MNTENPKYTIAVCNYNMAETLEESLRSILNQIDKRFEVLVVDDGSTDGSIKILDKLTEEYNNLHYIKGNNNNIGGARSFATEKARGDYILVQLDADDKYENVILDFVKLFHEIERQVDFDFFFSGNGLNIAKRTLFLDIPYRSLGYGEDRDLWRRLFDKNNIIWLKHKKPYTEIGYERNLFQQMRTGVESRMVDFQCNISFWSCILWSFRNELHELPYNLVAYPIAYLKSLNKEHYETPEEFKKKGSLKQRIEEEKMTLSETEEKYGIKVDKSKLSERGRDVFCL